MSRLFQHSFLTLALFCPCCHKALPHRLWTAERHSIHDTPPAHVPVLAECHRCKHRSFYATQELACFARKLRTRHKILGESFVALGDSAYSPIENVVGVVDSLARRGDSCEMELLLEDGSRKTLSAANGQNKEAYCLLPTQAQEALVGELFYDTRHHTTGMVAGKIFGERTALALRYQDGSLARFDLPQQAAIPDNWSFTQRATHFLESAVGQPPPGFKLLVEQGVCYLAGTLPRLALLRKYARVCAQIPQIRAVVERSTIEPPEKLLDSELARLVHETLDANKIPLVGADIECSYGKVTVTGYSTDEFAECTLRSALEELPIRRLFLEVHYRPESHEMRLPFFDNERVRAVLLDDFVYLEGTVHSKWQKRLAWACAVIQRRNFKVKNLVRTK
jgi:hypothetical protein